jgi:predicted secreted hydrolase
VRLPRDHGAHPGFQIEWWYTAGTVSAGHQHYFWFATVWSGGRRGVLARVNVVDLGRDRIVLTDQYFGFAPLHLGQRAVSLGGFHLGWRPSGPRGRWSVDATTPSGRLTLALDPAAPYVLNGPRGIIQQGPGGRSAYYSEPRLAARGVLQIGRQKVRVSGLGWLDHQWGNFATSTSALRWNWFACQFSDGRDLMLYQFLDARERPAGTRSSTFVTSAGGVSHLSRFSVRPLEPYVRPAGARVAYPLRWRLVVPRAGIDITIQARARRQFIRNVLLPSFWEGAAAIVRGGSGGCIVESTREVSAGL